MSTYFSTCRLCGDHRENGPKGPMIKYGVRHYTHAECALAKWGSAFFDRLHDWQVRNFPAVIAAQFGLFEELKRRIDAMPPEKAWS